MTQAVATVWSDVLDQVRHCHPDLVRSWFSDLSAVTLERGVFCIRADNAAQLRYLDGHCRRAFSDAAQAVTGCLVSIEFAAPEESNDVEPFSDSRAWNAEFTFESFVDGPCNRLARAVAGAVAEEPGCRYNPLFLHGGEGLGKTHLLQAIGYALRERNPAARCWYGTGDDFTIAQVQAAEQGNRHALQALFREYDVLLIDDVERFSGRERSQEEFFRVFNSVQEAQGQIVLTAKSPPTQLEGIAERLCSRFGSGMVSAVEPPCAETRAAIARSKAVVKGIQLSDAVIETIGEFSKGSIRDLEESLLGMDAVAQMRDGVVTREIALEVLEAPRIRALNVPSILDRVARKFHVDPSELTRAGRSKSISQPRQVGMYLARHLTDLTLERIGEFFGGRDHTTVRHAAMTITKRMESDQRLRRVVADLIEEIRGERGS